MVLELIFTAGVEVLPLGAVVLPLGRKMVCGRGHEESAGPEVLSIMLNQLPHIHQFRGFSMVQSGPQATHLAYADDVVIFSSDGKRAFKLVMHQLQNYEKCFGQLINIGKSCFLVDPKASNITIQRIKEVVGYRHANFPITYLGCPLYVGRKRILHFSDIVSKLVKRTTGWQGKLLSVGDRATLIKHVLQSQPIYLLSALEPPKTVFKQLETYMARFFWGSYQGKKKYHWSSWSNLCYPKEEGGLGFRSILDVSKSLTMKRWWRFRTCKSLWSIFLMAKYCSNHPVFVPAHTSQSNAWKNLLKIRDKVEDELLWKINAK
ncbi:PREDICTED: uncharacterized protein LOC109216039 [Nicotiana attenuata]|uniref:uncharacterized protein LOC109216039 n=1 Tax=Nicotiana attenuata TaxID=49451 RepID=UPI0009046A5E|nr:PREDICTED: uncharacterized protein LOC109216039 [Nicotiana attenuata]